MPKANVCHLIHNYLPFSQNWLYYQLKGIEQHPPFVLTCSEPVNRRYFPLKEIRQAYKVKKHSLEDAKYYLNNGFWPQMASFAEGFKPALLHAHFGINGVAALDWKNHYSLPLITSFYGYDAGILGRQVYWQNVYSKLFQSGELFLAEGPHMRSSLQQLGCPEKKIIIQNIGINTKKIKYIRHERTSNNPLIIIMAARLVEKKGHFVALKAFAKFIQDYKNAHLKIIGGGELLSDTKQLAKELKINKKVTFIPSLTYQDYLSELQSGHIFLQPSQTALNGDMEGGAPVSLLEAQAMGMAIVATTHADIPYYVINQKTGLLAPEKDWRMLARHLLNIANNPNLLRTFAENGRTHIEENFNLIVQRKKLAAIYSNLLKMDKKGNSTQTKKVYYLPFLRDAATIFSLNSDWETAQKIQHQILNYDKNNWHALWQLAQIFEKKKDYENAASFWKQSLLILEKNMEISPGISKHTGLAAYSLAINQLRRQQVGLAEKYFRKAYQYNPDITNALYHLGSILKTRARLDKSQAFLERFLTRIDSKDEMHAKTLFHLGDIAFRRNQLAKAEKLLKSCLSKLPQHKMAARLLDQARTFG